MNIGEEEYTEVVEDGILTMKGRLLVQIGADLQNAYDEGYKQGKKDASENIIRCSEEKNNGRFAIQYEIRRV